jgi:hypothetical protein
LAQADRASAAAVPAAIAMMRRRVIGGVLLAE